MDTRQLVLDSFAKLEDEGRRIMAASGWDGKEFYSHPSSPDYLRFRTEAMNLIRRSCGEDSDHYKEIRRIAEGKDSANLSYYFSHCFGILEAAHRDFEAGLLFEIRSLVAAELLDDFISQANALFEAGYHVPAASLAGAVLEDTLRKLCERNAIKVPEKTKIDSLNSELTKLGVYDKLVQKRITALADIRNNADHGHFDKFTKPDVEDMLRWITRFTADSLR
jgi:hypothetical protein